jgi:restriction endonuclease S subunit
LNGLEAVELKFSEVLKDNDEFRINSEFYKKRHIQIKEKLLSINYKYLSKFNTFNARYGQPDYNETSSIKVLNSRYLRDYFLDYDSAKYGFGSIVPKNAIMINATGVGTLGRVNINYLKQSFTIDNHINIIIANNINPYYLMIFLKSYYGQSQINRYYSGSSGQIEIYSKNFDNFIIPIFSDTFQLNIENLVKLSHQKLENSKTLYKQAEELLLKELDLLDYKPSKEKIAIKNLSESFGVSGRLDSEYYQPKYDEILEKIKNYKGGYEKLKYFSKSYSTGYPFKSDSYVDDGTYLIRINNIKKGYLDISNASKIPNDDKYLSLKDIANENDVLISMSGTIGNSCKIPQGISAVINQRIMKITPKNINFELLPLLINSIICQNQLERIGTGGVQTNISSSDILNILIPLIDNKIQIQIEQKIKKSFELKEQSKELLDIAKKAVEIAIEEDEDIAMKYINDQI